MHLPHFCPDHPGLTRDDIITLLKTFTRSQLQEKLRAVQLRLGSQAERPNDVDCAQLLVHQINNVLTAERVDAMLRQLDQT